MQEIIIPALAMKVNGYGILITGESRSGKSNLAFALLDRGHKFIADDAVRLYQKNNFLYIANPQQKFFSEIRGLGFINIERHYGFNAICNYTKLLLIVELVDELETKQDLTQQITEECIFNCIIKKYQILSSNNNLAVIIEIMINYHNSNLDGYDSHQDFINHHVNNF